MHNWGHQRFNILNVSRVFVTQMGNEEQQEKLLREWLDCCVTEGGMLAAMQKSSRRRNHPLVTQMVEKWLDRYRQIRPCASLSDGEEEEDEDEWVRGRQRRNCKLLRLDTRLGEIMSSFFFFSFVSFPSPKCKSLRLVIMHVFSELCGRNLKEEEEEEDTSTNKQNPDYCSFKSTSCPLSFPSVLRSLLIC